MIFQSAVLEENKLCHMPWCLLITVDDQDKHEHYSPSAMIFIPSIGGINHKYIRKAGRRYHKVIYRWMRFE